MNHVFICVGTVLAAAGSAMQVPVRPLSQPAARGPAPRIVAAQAEYDMGKIWAGDKIEQVVVFRNVGQREAAIESVRADCGCTVLSDWPKTLAPGQEGQVTATIDTTGRMGPLRKSVHVISNDPVHKQLQIFIKAEVRKALEVDPSEAAFGTVQQGKQATREIKILNWLEQPLVFESVKSDSPRFVARLEPVQEGKQYKLVVTAVPPFAPKDNKALIRLTPMPGAEKHVPFTVMAHAYLMPRINFPDRILLPGTVTRPHTRMILVQNNGNTDLKVTETESTNPSVTARTAPIVAGRSYKVTLSVDPGAKIVKGDKIVLHTNDQEFPRLEVLLETMAPPPIRAAASRPATMAAVAGSKGPGR